MLLINLKTRIEHATFPEVEQLARQHSLRLGPATGAYPRRALHLQFNRLKAHSPRLTIKHFITLTQTTNH